MVSAMVEDDHSFELRSYGRRRARKPSARQADLLHKVYPRVALSLSRPHCPSGETWLEIGFGGGEHLLWQAVQNPKVAFLGCEPFEDGMIKVLTAIDEQKLTNIQVHMGDAREVLRWLVPASIDRVFILFPDPWPKRRHAKRRLMSPQTLDLLAKAMKPGAELRFASDIGVYIHTSLRSAIDHPAFGWQAESCQDWRNRPQDWPQTRYEAKALREGRKPYFFTFIRK